MDKEFSTFKKNETAELRNTIIVLTAEQYFGDYKEYVKEQYANEFQEVLKEIIDDHIDDAGNYDKLIELVGEYLEVHIEDIAANIDEENYQAAEVIPGAVYHCYNCGWTGSYPTCPYCGEDDVEIESIE